MRSGLLLTITAAAAALPAATAHAGNDDSFFQGNEAAMTAGAVNATVSDASAIWYNPTGLGGNERSRLELSGTAFACQHRRIPDGISQSSPTAGR